MPETRKYTEAQKKSAKKWDTVNLDRLSLALPRGSKDIIKNHAQTMGESVNGFISRAITETMDRDSAPKEVIFGRAVDILAEWYEASPWDVLDKLKGLKDQGTPTPGGIEETTPAPSDGQD